MKIHYDYNSRRIFYREDSKEPTNWKTKKLTVSNFDEECGLVQQELFVYDDDISNKKMASPQVLKCFISVIAVLALIFTILVWTFSLSNNLSQDIDVRS